MRSRSQLRSLLRLGHGPDGSGLRHSLRRRSPGAISNSATGAGWAPLGPRRRWLGGPGGLGACPHQRVRLRWAGGSKEASERAQRLWRRHRPLRKMSCVTRVVIAWRNGVDGELARQVTHSLLRDAEKRTSFSGKQGVHELALMPIPCQAHAAYALCLSRSGRTPHIVERVPSFLCV